MALQRKVELLREEKHFSNSTSASWFCFCFIAKKWKQKPILVVLLLSFMFLSFRSLAEILSDLPALV